MTVGIDDSQKLAKKKKKNLGGKKGQSHCEAKRNYLCLSNGKVF